MALRKHAYSNIVKISQPKKKRKSDKGILIFFIFLLKTDSWYSLEPPRSIEYPQSILTEIRKK